MATDVQGQQQQRHDTPFDHSSHHSDSIGEIFSGKYVHVHVYHELYQCSNLRVHTSRTLVTHSCTTLNLIDIVTDITYGRTLATHSYNLIREKSHCTILPLDSRNQESAQIPSCVSKSNSNSNSKSRREQIIPPASQNL